ncbi:MAG TPA: tRNA(Met) cytidine acetyltransferase [Gammaproteobacteria bacterium]|nr:tRNA(Met) cytidine acetyltransferase [Gammaproteobacteria bacterium]
MMEQILQLAAEARRHRQRRAAVLAGARDWGVAMAQQVLESLQPAHRHWFSEAAPGAEPASQGAAAMKLLGSELDALVFDAWAGFDPDAFGALSGTLRAGGLLLLLTPPFADWPAFDDPENRRITVAPWKPEQLSGRFLARLCRVIREDPEVMLCEPGGVMRMPPARPAPPPASVEVEAPYRTPDQKQAVEAVIHVATGHRRRPVVLISDRGRGKSAAFGIAAARLLQLGRRRILLTGPRRESVEAVMRHARELAGEFAAGLEFVAPDELARELPEADMVLVDEAAAIPAPLLETLLRRYARIAFATTVHGYEGTGRGFAVRFSRTLDACSNSWKSIRLSTPIRWAADDPLERLVFRMLLLDAEAAPDEALQQGSPEAWPLERLDRDRLAEDEGTLSELFGLLVLAHYRTRPLDLRHLLDGPNLSVWVVRAGGHVAATALMAAEGGFDQDTAAAIWSGRVRPHGHLLPETLAAHQGLREAPRLRAARIMRIAVHPAVQGRGLGTRLVQAIRTRARQEGFDYLGSSFGATPELLDFWNRQGWTPVRVSIQRGAASGAHSVVMLEALDGAGERLRARALQRFLAQFPWQLGDSLSQLESALVWRLLASTREFAAPDEDDLHDLHAFAHEQRLAEVCLGSLWRLALHALTTGAAVQRLEPVQLELLIARVLQHQDWQECVRRTALEGRVAALNALRAVVAKLID